MPAYSSTNDILPDCKWRPYAANSWWNKPVPFNPPLDPRTGKSNDPMKFTKFSIAQNIEQGNVADDWTHPTYHAQAADPQYTITINQYGKEINGEKVRLPNGAKPAAGGDGHLDAIDWSTSLEYSFWQAKVDHTKKTIVANGGGRGNITTGDGIDDVGSATAACVGCSAGMIRAVELAGGVIDHALFLVPTLNDTPSWSPRGGPAQTSGTIWPSGSRPHCGQKLALMMTWAEIDALNLKSYEKTVLRALSRYGGVDCDTGHYSTLGVDIMVESQLPYTTFLGKNPFQDWCKSQGMTSMNIGPALDSVKSRMRWLAHP